MINGCVMYFLQTVAVANFANINANECFCPVGNLTPEWKINKQGMLTIELSPHVLEIPNDTNEKLSQNLIDSQEYCKLIG